MLQSKLKNAEHGEKERCVLCGAETAYSFDTPIDLRLYYIEGAGQLCHDCYNDLYREKKRQSH